MGFSLISHPAFKGYPPDCAKEMNGRQDQMQHRAEAEQRWLRWLDPKKSRGGLQIQWFVMVYVCTVMMVCEHMSHENDWTWLFKIAHPISRSSHLFVGSRPSERTSRRAADVKEICNKRGIYAVCGPSSWMHLHYCTSEALLHDGLFLILFESIIVFFLQLKWEHASFGLWFLWPTDRW